MSLQNALQEFKPQFDTKNVYGLVFDSEKHYAIQQITKNDYTLDTARNNPQSMKNAVMNVAAIGISLNPANAHAYLVPRDGGICLDISYRGLVKLATDSGAIEFAIADLVYEGDTFTWKGPLEPPVHEFDPFDEERFDAKNPLEKLRGGYCIAKLASGEYMVTRMTAAEINEVKNTSKAKRGPWQGQWAGEMAKKTIIKRAYKSWPQSNGRERLDLAVSVLNEHEGLEEMEVTERAAASIRPSKEQSEKYVELAAGDPVGFYIWFQSLPENVQAGLPGIEFPHGQKQKMMKFYNGQLHKGQELLQTWVDNMREMIEVDDPDGALEFLLELSGEQLDFIKGKLTPQHLSWLAHVERLQEGAA